ncbi:hemerythrin domain-containing protein [Cyclobacterium amurskyense]|uniref:Nitric oxide-dependent regulator DnrN or NorA n=1 Tax=Cyclobacterium amurskyense TaxID=320787 RepID=A0A0H4PG56_9BACT|nr:hemerythrin domain-containing protein [Cyclobacterium amurskyense]AKP51818.1 Nitric oxide-dependent regulator DnrN or NorA [Cyclobacterium amurskyense]
MHSSKNKHRKSIGELVTENHVLAEVLHYFGISFFQHEQHSLEDVCAKYKVNPSQVIDELEEWASRVEPTSDELFLHPIGVLVGYLKKKHRYFIRQALPFLTSMVEGIEMEKSQKSLITDLRLMFPLFVDDFIHHIHEEEDTLFERIAYLHEIENGSIPLNEAIKVFALPSIQRMAAEHDAHDDEMKGIRKLTNDYLISKDASISVRVLYLELQKLESELMIHAKIENDLLFPKAVELEREVFRRLHLQIKSN